MRAGAWRPGGSELKGGCQVERGKRSISSKLGRRSGGASIWVVLAALLGAIRRERTRTATLNDVWERRG